MRKTISFILIGLLLLLLILIRAFEANLFYDPLIEYFQNDYLYSAMPKLDKWRLVFDMFFRFTLNSVITLAIIGLLFKRKDYVKFSSIFLIIIFSLLMIVFLVQLKDNFESGYLLPFYVRRFIIHPLFLLVLLPAFYYQKLTKR